MLINLAKAATLMPALCAAIIQSKEDVESCVFRGDYEAARMEADHIQDMVNIAADIEASFPEVGHWMEWPEEKTAIAAQIESLDDM